MSGVSLGLKLEGAGYISNSAMIVGAVSTTGSGTPQENPATFIGCECIGEALYSGARIDLIVITTFVLNTAFIGEVLVLVGTVSLEWWDFIENWFNEYRVQGVPTTVSFWTTHTVSLTTMPSTANQGSI